MPDPIRHPEGPESWIAGRAHNDSLGLKLTYSAGTAHPPRTRPGCRLQQAPDDYVGL